MISIALCNSVALYVVVLAAIATVAAAFFCSLSFKGIIPVLRDDLDHLPQGPHDLFEPAAAYKQRLLARDSESKLS